MRAYQWGVLESDNLQYTPSLNFIRLLRVIFSSQRLKWNEIQAMVYPFCWNFTISRIFSWRFLWKFEQQKVITQSILEYRAFSRKMLIWLGLEFDEELQLYCDMMICIPIIAFRWRRMHTFWVFLRNVHEVENYSICQAISRFGCHLGPAWHILPRFHVFSFSHPGAGIYFVTLVRSQKRWRFSINFTTGLFISFSRSFQLIQSVFLYRKISILR